MIARTPITSAIANKTIQAPVLYCPRSSSSLSRLSPTAAPAAIIAAFQRAALAALRARTRRWGMPASPAAIKKRGRIPGRKRFIRRYQLPRFSNCLTIRPSFRSLVAMAGWRRKSRFPNANATKLPATDPIITAENTSARFQPKALTKIPPSRVTESPGNGGTMYSMPAATIKIASTTGELVASPMACNQVRRASNTRVIFARAKPARAIAILRHAPHSVWPQDMQLRSGDASPIVDCTHRGAGRRKDGRA